DYDGRTPLHDAVQSENYVAVKCLIDAGASVHKKTFIGQTPLHSAAQFANPARKVTRLLLELGASTHQADNDGYCPLHVAGDTGNVDVLEVL
ncbi:ankyrin, partial [Terfezia boudieri ATCC MYA-4762]